MAINFFHDTLVTLYVPAHVIPSMLLWHWPGHEGVVSLQHSMFDAPCFNEGVAMSARAGQQIEQWQNSPSVHQYTESLCLCIFFWITHLAESSCITG